MYCTTDDCNEMDMKRQWRGGTEKGLKTGGNRWFGSGLHMNMKCSY